MCKKIKGCGRRIDKCMQNLVSFINETNSGWQSISSCCGHGKYRPTLILETFGIPSYLEVFSGKLIPKRRKIYKKDKNGYYFIPELEKEKC
jgi:hypothetical protein